MSTARAVRAILVHDGRRLARDRFLLGAAAYLVGCAVALRWAIPWLRAELLAGPGVDPTPWVPLGVSYFVLVNASVVTGIVGGFLLLESREERAVSALLVTPTPLEVQLGTLGGAMAVAGAGLAAVEAAIVGTGVPPWPAALAASALGAPTGLVMGLMLATLASNKVEAFAVLKLTTLVGLVPVAAWFVPEPWQLLAGVVPSYWACKLWWIAAEGQGSWAWTVPPGLAVSAAWLGVLVPRFRAVVRG